MKNNSPFLYRTGFFVLISVALLACQSPSESTDVLPDGKWLEGSDQEKIHSIEKQFRGFGNTMWETGYRYQELYWAGMDKNWEYAEHQLEELAEAVEYGLVRRPKRAESAQYFLNQSIPQMEEAIEQKDSLVFFEEFKLLTESCNSCHAMEEMPFLKVQTPTQRQSPIRW